MQDGHSPPIKTIQDQTAEERTPAHVVTFEQLTSKTLMSLVHKTVKQASPDQEHDLLETGREVSIHPDGRFAARQKLTK